MGGGGDVTGQREDHKSGYKQGKLGEEMQRRGIGGEEQEQMLDYILRQKKKDVTDVKLHSVS